MTPTERILLVRHGVTDWNQSGRWQGSIPVALNAEGWAQARALGAHLRGRRIGAIYTSDLPRAWETASAIGEAVGVLPQADVRLREFHLGIFEGLTRDEIEATYTAEWQAFEDDFWDYVIPRGESRRDLLQRMYDAWLDIVANAAGHEVVIVSHGGAIKTLLLKLFDGDPAVRDVRLHNTSVTTLQRNGAGWHLVDLADTGHLENISPEGSGETTNL
jgi:broad specificity phosphatase PhoE